jgi:hypothetical protein
MKKKVTNAEELAEAIAELELKAASQKRDLQKTFNTVSENLKPINLVKSGVRSLFSGDYNESLLNALIGIGTGFLGRKLIIGKTKSFFGKTVGKAIQWTMAGLVSKNAEKIKEKAGDFIDRIFKKHKPGTNHAPIESPRLEAQSSKLDS